MTVLTRAYSPTLEIRDDGRTLFGLAVPYNVEARIVEGRNRYTETFTRGAFADAATHTLTAKHPKTGDDLPIGVSVELREEADGLHGEWHVSDVPLGNDVLTLVRDKVPLGLSIGFVEGRNRWNRNRTRVERLSATVDHTAVVRQGAYLGAEILGVRHAQQPGAPRLLVARLRARP